MQKKAQKKKTYNLPIFAVLILFVVLTAFIVYIYTDKDSHSEIDSLVTGETFSDTATYNNTVAPDDSKCKDESNNTVTPVGDNSKDEWYLTLVNRWNPIKNDVDVDVVQLSNGERVDSRIYPYLQQMFDDMRSDGIYPVVASGYRTEAEQQQIYDNKVDEYVSMGYSITEARELTEMWVAVPGTSEHQLGIGVDINADGVHSYGNEVYNWLLENAHLYGFIKRYPDDKTDITGISNEPWHYRYVGIDAATEIHERGICLEEFLGRIE